MAHCILVSSRCNLKCAHCRIWQTEPTKSTADMSGWVASQSFMSTRSTWVDVCGGEPLLAEGIAYLLAAIKSAGHKVRLWSNGIGCVATFDQVAEWVDELVLFVPGYLSEGYVSQAGRDGFTDMTRIIQLAKESGCQVVMSTITRPDHVQWLPEIVELARYRFRVAMLVQYFQNDTFSSESIAYIKRLKRQPMVGVVKRSDHVSLLCLAVPRGPVGFLDRFRWWWARTVQM